MSRSGTLAAAGVLGLIGVIVPVPSLSAEQELEEFQRLSAVVPPHFAPSTEGTEAGIWMITNKAEEQIKASPSRVNDPELEGYLRDVMCRLAPDYCSDIRLYVVRVPMFNASMMPNGVMQVWTGLLLRARTEAQIASVLGHELGHYLQRHGLNGFERMKSTANAMAFLTLGLSGAVSYAGVNPYWAQGSLNLGQFALIASYFAFSRIQESEADKFGIQMISDAGYAPDQASHVWANLIAEEDAASAVQERPSIFLASHPNSKDRMQQLGKYAAALARENAPTPRADSGDYRERINPHLPMLLEDELNLHQPGRTEYLFASLLADGTSPGLLKFYLAELYRSRGKDGDRDAAIRLYREARQHTDCPPDANKSLGILYLKSKQFDLANESFSEYLTARPQASDREMIEYYMSMKE